MLASPPADIKFRPDNNSAPALVQQQNRVQQPCHRERANPPDMKSNSCFWVQIQDLLQCQYVKLESHTVTIWNVQKEIGTSYYRHDVGNGGINVVSGKYTVVDSNVVQSNHMGSPTVAAMWHNHMWKHLGLVDGGKCSERKLCLTSSLWWAERTRPPTEYFMPPICTSFKDLLFVQT